jgi:tetratricopeptide (TPR) repeat protein
MVDAAARGGEQDKSANPDAADFVMRGTAAYFRLNSETNLNEAQKNFERALAIDPQSIEAKVGLANVLLEFVINARKHIVDGITTTPGPDVERSEKLLVDALEQDARNPQVVYTLGRLRWQQNHLDDGKTLLEKAIFLDPNDSRAYHTLGLVEINLGNPEAAIPLFKKRIELDPGSPNTFFAYWWLGYSYLLLEKSDQAIDFFNRARVLNPRFAASYLYLASALGMKGDIDAAKTAVAEAFKLRPEPRTVKGLLALAAYRIGSPKYFELREKTAIAGLRLAGVPEE